MASLLRTTGCHRSKWCHTILLAARHKRAHPVLIPAGEGWYSIDLPRRDGRLSWLGYVPAWNRTHDRLMETWKVRRSNRCTITTNWQPYVIIPDKSWSELKSGDPGDHRSPGTSPHTWRRTPASNLRRGDPLDTALKCTIWPISTSQPSEDWESVEILFAWVDLVGWFLHFLS